MLEGLLVLGGFGALLTLILWVLLSIVVGAGASNRGRDGFGWFILSILLSPALGGFMLVVLGERRKKEPKERLTARLEEPSF
jgi:hypothetical protein